jgi:hypothetical protein
LSLDRIAPAAFNFAVEVEALYQALLGCSQAQQGAEPGLGGKLLYAGELADHGRALMVAGNISGAATLAATADPGAQKQAIREGVADFLVTSLDEALRVLKNEIRKRETVAVCVAAAPHFIEREMQDRGVLPDLLPPPTWVAAAFGQGSRRLPDGELEDDRELIVWSVPSSPARWLPKLDVLAFESFCGQAGHAANYAGRWLRLAPRYLGRLAQGFRVMRAAPEVAQEFVSRVQRSVADGAIGVEVEISLKRSQQEFLIKPQVQTA